MSNASKFKVRFPKLVGPLVIHSNADILKYATAGLAGFALFEKLNQTIPAPFFAEMSNTNLTSSLFILVAGGYAKRKKEKTNPASNTPKTIVPAPEQP